MPDFEIEGNAGNIRSKALTMEQKGQLFYDTGDALSKIDVSGWTGRAADEFREAHDLEPERWYKSGNGFKKAAAGLRTYAGELESAQSRAEWAREEHGRGQRESESARTQYGSYMDQMRSYWSSGGTDQAQPFNDWGAPIQQDALQELAAARADLENAAHVCAGEVRAGCADAPEEPNWLESGLTFVGGIFEGAGEAIWDLLTMVPFSPVNMVIDSYKLATGDITPDNSGNANPAIAWNHDRMGNYMQTPILVGALLFGCSDVGLLTCFDAKTGQVRYSERFSKTSEGYTASPVSDGRHLYITSELGNVAVIPVAEKFSLAASNKLDETCLSTPAISEGALFFRTRSKLVAVGAKR